MGFTFDRADHDFTPRPEAEHDTSLLEVLLTEVGARRSDDIEQPRHDRRDPREVAWSERALQAFGGTCVFVSHDRGFLASLATSVLEIKEGKATYYPCDYEQYRWRLARDAQEAADQAKQKQAKQAQPEEAP